MTHPPMEDTQARSREIAPARPRIMIVDDDQSLREFLEIFFAKQGYKVCSASTGREALALMDTKDVSIVLSDVRMPEMDGVTLLRKIKAKRPEIPVILITAFASLETAVDAMKEGAWDYLAKPFQLDEIREVVDKALESRLTTQPISRDAECKIYRLDRMVAKSPAMLKIFQLIPRIADSTSSVLITGESGTGKELVARAIHNLGTRAGKPFVVVNCGGIPENLLESELFGYAKGAFTGAVQEKQGLFTMAHGGTLFLDEIGELPMMLQVKLLRVVQEKSFIPLGGTRENKVDVRIIAATNRDLEREVMGGRFREDLYYRLNVINIRTPPLRERPEDIPLLVQYFLDKYSKEQGKAVQGISSFAMNALIKYPFPGNVRELENIIERSVALSSSSLILPESLSLARHKQNQDNGGNKTPETPDKMRPILPEGGMDLDAFLGQVEKSLLVQALEKTGGVKVEAAKLLGLNFRSFRYRLAKYGL